MSPPYPTDPVWAIVPAAGSGRRMGGDIPKQYLPLAGKTVIEHTLERLLAVDGIAAILVALNPHDTHFASLSIAANDKIDTVPGGSERSDSVLSALNFLQAKARPRDWVLVHDAVRCCVKSAMINRLLAGLKDDPVGGILGVPVSDTLKQINPEQQIITTLDRQGVWQAQTPQVFRYELLQQALEQARTRGQVVTDEASAMELAGYRPKIISGHRDNIKITHPEDLPMAAAILQQQALQQQFPQQPTNES